MDYKQRIQYMAEIFDKNCVPYTINQILDGYQLRFPWHCGDVCAHCGTYGAARGYVESYQFPWDEGDVTTDTPEAMAARVVTLYNEVFHTFCFVRKVKVRIKTSE